MATTNYDSLIEGVSGWERVTWTEAGGMQRALQGDDNAVVHLHGHWRDPVSVVLGVRSYDELTASGVPQALQRAIATMSSLLFVGVGSGLSDPNVGPLRAWLAATFPGSEYRHYRLCLNDEVDELVELHAPHDRIFPVAYGDRHDQLAEFLGALGSAPAGAAVARRAGSRPSASTAEPATRLEAWIAERVQAQRLLARERPVQGNRSYFTKMGEWELETVEQMPLDEDPVAPGLVDEFRRYKQPHGIPGIEPPHGVREYDEYYARRLEWLELKLNILRAGEQELAQAAVPAEVAYPLIPPEHLERLRGLLTATDAAIANEREVLFLGPLEKEFERGIISAHFGPLIPDLRTWDEAVREHREAPRKLREKFSEEVLARGLNNPPYNGHVIAQHLSDMTERGSLAGQLNAPLVLDRGPDSIWSGWADGSMNIEKRPEPAIKLPQLVTPEELETAENLIAPVDELIRDAQTWREAAAVREAFHRLQAFPREQLRETIRRLTMAETIRQSDECPLCQLNRSGGRSPT
ncbi:MAG: SIR2 family protein [Solirubrobacterales bacterium]|nr:SIR2 family protein [Solirubrobacterales bacterium]